MVINGIVLLNTAPILNMELSKQIYEGTSYGLTEAGYDIRIAQSIYFSAITSEGKRTITIEDPNTKQVSVSTTRSFATGFINEEDKFTLASAIEEFNMPVNLLGIVHDKSTWARQGLSVFNTVIEPGWKGFLTLELVYHRRKELYIPAGSGIAQIIFHQLIEPARYNGKYQNQPNHPVEAKQ